MSFVKNQFKFILFKARSLYYCWRVTFIYTWSFV